MLMKIKEISNETLPILEPEPKVVSPRGIHYKQRRMK